MTTAEQLRQARGRLINRLKRQQNQVIELTDRVRALEEEVARLSARVAIPSPAEEKAAQLETRLNSWSPQTFSSSLLLGKGSKFGDRVVGQTGFDKLVSQVVDLTGTDPAATRRHLQIAYRSVILAEARSLGRIAGSTLNILGKLVTPRLLRPPNGRVLEIGTLFGVFGGALAHELARDGGPVELTVVDPLEGVQLQGGHVPTTDVSGTPVSEPVVRHNLEAAGLREPGFRIVEGYSTDEAVRHDVGDRTYGLVIVDGDHSEEGVKADLEWVESLVEPGTIVVLDDYGDARWPGVQAATDKHLTHSQVLSLAGLVSTSAYLIAGNDSAASRADSEQRRAPATASPARARLRAPREKTATLPAAQLPVGTAQASMFFDDYPRFGKRKRVMNLRHEAIIRQNADVLGGSRVLDLACSEGAWSFAALDAGAVHVIGVESREDKVENARDHFAEYGVEEDRYRFIAGDVFEVLARDQLRADVILCLGFLYHTLRYPELIHHIRQTGAHTLIIDTEVAVADGPFVRLLADNADMTGNASPDRYSVNNTVLTGRPTVAGLQKMVNVYGFAIERRSDWAAILRDNPGSEADVYAAGRRVTVMCQRGDEMTWRDGDSRR